jgi:ATP-dependent DNA helicase RecQ
MEISRMRQVLDFVVHEGCLVNKLVGYFGEKRAEPCGHCTYCVTGVAANMPPAPDYPPIDDRVSTAALRSLRSENKAALSEPRQMARLLCGLTSPATSRAKLTRDPLFGALEGYPFAEVMHWCERV